MTISDGASAFCRRARIRAAKIRVESSEKRSRMRGARLVMAVCLFPPQSGQEQPAARGYGAGWSETNRPRSRHHGATAAQGRARAHRTADFAKGDRSPEPERIS